MRQRAGCANLRGRAVSRGKGASDMEFLNFLLIFSTGFLVLRRPEREKLAFALLVSSALLMAFLFFVGTRTSILPPLNY